MGANPESTIKVYIRYKNWAGQEVLQACQNLCADQIAVMICGASGSIRNTLEHTIKIEQRADITTILNQAHLALPERSSGSVWIVLIRQTFPRQPRENCGFDQDTGGLVWKLTTAHC